MAYFFERLFSYLKYEVSVNYDPSTSLQVGKESELCSIKANNARFTTTPNICMDIAREGGRRINEDELQIRKQCSSDRDDVIQIFCRPKFSGKATVKLSLGWRYRFVGESQLSINIEPENQSTCTSPAVSFLDTRTQRTSLAEASLGHSSITSRRNACGKHVTRDTQRNSEIFEDNVNTDYRPLLLHKPNEPKIANDRKDQSSPNLPSFADIVSGRKTSATSTRAWDAASTKEATAVRVASRNTRLVENNTSEDSMNFYCKSDKSKTLVENERKDEELRPYVKLVPDAPPMFPEDSGLKCLIHLNNDSAQNAGALESFSAADLTVSYYKSHINVDELKRQSPGVLQATISWQKLNINEKGKALFKFRFHGKTMLLDLDFTVYQKFNETSSLSRQRIRASAGQGVRFLCKDVSKREIEGEDRCHLDNIERIFCTSTATDVAGESNDVLLKLPFLPAESVDMCRQVLLHLLRGIYYRKKASEMDDRRLSWKEKAIKEHVNMHGQSAAFCKKIKTKYADLMQRYNDEACEEIFKFFNTERGLYHIDLHGLLVVNEETMARDKEELLKDKPEEEVVNIINERRSRGDEAIRKLDIRIDEFSERMAKARREKKTWLEVIVGAGHHSKSGRQKIRPKVEEYLAKKYPNPKETLPNIKVVNEGSLVITYEEYPSTSKCSGHYYCSRCKKSWKSEKSFKNKWQGCFDCYENYKTLIKCFPVMQCPRAQPKHSTMAPQDGVIREHRKELCQVCSEGGDSCTS